MLSRQHGVPFIELGRFEIDAGVIRLLPAATARKYGTVPLARTGTALTVATTDPANVLAVDDIEFMTGSRVDTVVATQTAVAAAIERYYGGRIDRAGRSSRRASSPSPPRPSRRFPGSAAASK